MSVDFQIRGSLLFAGRRFPILAWILASLPAPLVSWSSASAADGAFQEAGGWDESSRTELKAALADRARHGLDHIDFLRTGDGDTQSADDNALNDAALGYAGALAHGIVDPASLHAVFTLAQTAMALEPALERAIARGNLSEWLMGLAPQDEEYVQLSQAYLEFRARAGNGKDPHIEGGLLRVGDVDPRLPAIAEQLIADEYLPASHAIFSDDTNEEKARIYTQQIADAVEQLQRDYGIVADGIIGPDTLGVLNFGLGDRARAIAVALERRRWLDRTPPATRIDVNTAAARLYYYRDGTLVDSRRVVVGKSGTETPPLQSPIYRLVANPTWTVPKSIQNGELANVSTDYLRRNNMELRNGWIVQRSGPDSALGLVKFDMQNEHAIYLHDTSAPELFDRSHRHRSHGCVRVEDALGFAQMLMEDQGLAEAWEQAQGEGEQQFVPLKNQIPVRLIYQNVFVDRDGRVTFRTDPYGWNAPIAKALGFSGGREHRLRSKENDIGP